MGWVHCAHTCVEWGDGGAACVLPRTTLATQVTLTHTHCSMCVCVSVCACAPVYASRNLEVTKHTNTHRIGGTGSSACSCAHACVCVCVCVCVCRMFWRGRIYGESDDVSRFLLFSRAALELLAWTGKTPDILHVHDWQVCGYVCTRVCACARIVCLCARPTSYAHCILQP